MTRIALWFSATTTALLLLFGYHTSLPGTASAQATTSAAGVVRSALPATSTGTVTVNGSTVSTQYGDIQVQVVLRGSTIVKATAVTYSTEGHNGEINAYAIPVLQDETVKAGSASIDTVSGATYTSEGYLQSLQSALDAAHA